MYSSCMAKVKTSPSSDGQADGQTFGQNPPQSSPAQPPLELAEAEVELWPPQPGPVPLNQSERWAGPDLEQGVNLMKHCNPAPAH